MATHSHWKDHPLPRFTPLAQDLKTEVLVIGGGMTGILTAYHLKKAGKKVVLIERDVIAQVNTGNTTSHLTCVTDLRLPELVKKWGKDGARAIWDAGLVAIERLAHIVAAEKIGCEFGWAPGFLVSSLVKDQDETKDLERDVDMARELGFPADFVAKVPVFGRPGIRFPNQAKFHPLKFLAKLVKRIPGKSCHVFDRSEAKEFEGERGRIRVHANGYVIQCEYVVVATDVPLAGLSNVASAAALQTKLMPYSSYAIGAKIPANAGPEACFWDTSDPYYYLRVDRQGRGKYAICGGLDHKTGHQDDTEKQFAELAEMLQRFFPQAKVDRQWSGQVIESPDGLPLIGETAPGQFVASGYSGNGITFGTIASTMICDAIMGRKNPWSELFDPGRVPTHGMLQYVRENIDYPYYMVKDRLVGSTGDGLSELEKGSGEILKIDGQRVAAYRDHNDQVTLLSPVCTHLGCIVRWNPAEASWDCPCHGSRFHCTGGVIAGPAETPLPRVEVDAKVH